MSQTITEPSTEIPVRDTATKVAEQWAKWQNRGFAAELDSGHHVKRALDKRFCASQYPWPS
jgi:hypothetical protein